MDLLASPLCLPERRSVREVHSVCFFFFSHALSCLVLLLHLLECFSPNL